MTLAVTLTLAATISSLLSVHLLTILQAGGMALTAAVALGALVGPAQVAAGRVEIDLPAMDDAAHGKQEVREVTVRGDSNGQSVGVLKLRVELRKRALPE